MINFTSAKCVESGEEEKRTDNVVNRFTGFIKWFVYSTLTIDCRTWSENNYYIDVSCNHRCQQAWSAQWA